MMDIPEASTAIAVPDHDAQLVELWLHGRPASTVEAYRLEIRRFLAFAGKPIVAVTLADVQAFADSLAHLAPASRSRALAAIKSLLAFGVRLGLLPVNVGAALRLPARRDTLSERILSEADVHRMLALEANPRNHALLRLFYASGCRVSELTGLRWRDVVEREEGGQITVWGKGAKTRAIRLPAPVWDELCALRGDAGADAPVFRSRNQTRHGEPSGGRLNKVQVERIVLAAARRAGIEGNVSPHWLRHCHGSHALDRGAPIHLVQATLGHASVATTGRYLHARPTESSGRYLAV